MPVINLEDGSRLSGDEAPRKKDLDSWMDKHPGYIIDSRDDEIEEGEIVSKFVTGYYLDFENRSHQVKK